MQGITCLLWRACRGHQPIPIIHIKPRDTSLDKRGHLRHGRRALFSGQRNRFELARADDTSHRWQGCKQHHVTLLAQHVCRHGASPFVRYVGKFNFGLKNKQLGRHVGTRTSPR